MIIKIILGVMIYIIIAFITTVLTMYVDRRRDYTSEYVYKNYVEYFSIGFFFPITLPVFLGYFIVTKLKVFAIAIVEYLIIKEDFDGKDNN